MRFLVLLSLVVSPCSMLAATIRVDVNAMPTVVFTGDSQTCGRVGAIDYAQMLSWELPIRVINTAVGGTSTQQLLSDTNGRTAHVKKGEKVIKGTRTGWHAGPYPGQRVRLATQEYVIDRIEVESYKDWRVNLWLTEPAKEDFDGKDYTIEAGWRVRVAERKPDYVCFMYSVNDTRWTSERFRAQLEDMVERTRALGAQPIFISGVPLMDAGKGGSHPGINRRVTVRANDLAAFCSEKRIPFGDVFSAMMLLDEQCTGTWADTVHPTTDGSIAALSALRTIFHGLGVAANPYYVRGYRPPGKLAAPGPDLVPITTCQPDYNAQNRPDDNHFDLAAIHVRDEYALIAAADGDVLQSDTPLVLEFGVGEPKHITAARAELVLASEAKVSTFDRERAAWQPLAAGKGRVSAPLAVDGRAVWIAVESEGTVALDYAAVVLEGKLSPHKARPVDTPIVWPPDDYLTWQPDGSLIPNGNLAQAHGDAPAHWQKHGDQALYIRTGIVAQGVGGFAKRRRVDLFRSPGQRFKETLRPLDLLTTSKGPKDALGRFIIADVMDDETLRMRRFPKEEVSGLAFEVTRPSGCAVVPEACMLQCRGQSRWQTAVPRLDAGSYRLGLFYRAYDPPHMNAKNTPGRAAKVTVQIGDGTTPVAQSDLVASYQWQRAWLVFDVQAADKVTVSVAAAGDVPVEYTGVTIHELHGKR